jgi:hypothetical protein
MSNRLNQEREADLTPKRVQGCKEKLESLGFEVTATSDRLDFIYKGSKIMFWPYSGWHSGKTIKDGRGFNNLLNQIQN